MNELEFPIASANLRCSSEVCKKTVFVFLFNDTFSVKMYAKNYKNAIFGLLSRKMLQQVSRRAFLLDRIVMQHSMWYGNVWV